MKITIETSALNFIEIISFSLNALKDRKVRSILTILMVIIGASLMVSLNGMGAGMNIFIDKQFSRFSPNVMFVTPAPMIMGQGGEQTNPVDLNDRTVNNLEKISNVIDTVPIMMNFANIKSGSQSMSLMIMGLDQSKAHYIAPNIGVSEGNLISSYDGVGIVVGHDVKHPAGQSMEFVRLGQAVTIEYSTIEDVGGEQKVVMEKRAFIVRGVLESLGSSAFFQMDNIALISLQAANSFFKSSSEYDAILVVTKNQDYNTFVEEEIREIYGKDIGITTPKSIVETIQGFIGGFSMFILGIAVVSMIVAAVGVITTLLTSVMERTREIGTLKALGFKNSSIMTLFITEAVFIGIIGASVGLLLGMGLGSVLLGGLLARNMMIGAITPIYLLRDLSFVWIFSVSISTIAGLYPAWRASRLDPVVALRKE